MNPILRLLRYAIPYRGRLVVALLAMAVYAAASGLLAMLIKPIIDDVLPSRERLGFVAAMLVACYVFKGLGSYASVYLMTDVGQRLVRDVRNELFGNMLDQSAGFFSRRTTGQLMSRLTNDVSRVQHVVSETVGDLVRELLAVLVYAGLLFYYDARLALVCLTGAPLIVYPLVRIGQRVRRTTRRSQEELEVLSHISAEAFTGHRIVKAFGAERHERRKFADAAHRLFRTNMKVTSSLAALPPVMELLGGLLAAGLLWYASREITTGQMTPGDFTAFLAILFLSYGPIRKLSRVNANVQQAIAASERIFEILDTHTESEDRAGARPLETIRDAIEFRDVSFAYERDDGRQILRRVSFTVGTGQMVAIVGLSGAGKTTLVNLIPRFYDVTGGGIFVDGIDLRDVILRSLRALIGIVTQDTVLFDDTIANNIAYGSPGVSRATIEAAARTAHAHEFIVSLPKQYDTWVGERGQRLSGGQRQRVAIARALLRNSPILILDEATSSLDAESELLVQDALSHLMQDRTAFVIAHRLSTVHRADAIIVLEEGRVVETGHHDELLAQPGSVYAKLYALQIFEPSELPSDVSPVRGGQ